MSAEPAMPYYNTMLPITLYVISHKSGSFAAAVQSASRWGLVAVLRKLFLAIIVIALAWLAWEWITFPNVARLATEPPSTTAFMELRKKQLRAEGKDDTILYQWVSYGRISPYLRRAALVAEDDDFYHHDGVDMKGIQEAIQKDWQKGTITHGGSTITQQLAKNLYLSPSRNPFRKLKEYFIARSLERHLTKKRILEIYLNVVEMGERVYGAEAAARFYFHESASALNPQQAALLGGCLPNPRIMNPGSPNKRLRWRQRMILSRMRRWGYLFEQEVLTEKKPGTTPGSPQPTDTDLTPPSATDTATPAPPDETTTTTTTAAPTETTTEPSPSSPPAQETAAPPPGDR
jgi:monofunctional biosynthetic peptidoglycan transglycosylase